MCIRRLGLVVTSVLLIVGVSDAQTPLRRVATRPSVPISIRLPPRPAPNYFVHKAAASNISQNWTTIDHPLTNGRPRAILIVTPIWNPGGAQAGVYNAHPVGVWYTQGHWAIFNQDRTSMPPGAAFNVWVARQESEAPRRSVMMKRSSTTNSDLQAIWVAIDSLRVAVELIGAQE